MKTFILTIILAICNFISQAQQHDGIDITVTINNVKNDNGFVLLGLHNQQTFMNKSLGALERKKATITDGQISIVFNNVIPGNYAIIAVHDENANNQMDFELNGMPKEAYGMSNNNMSFGPPLFGDAKFTVTDKNLTFDIRF
ncbi:MAG: DUF2141 domain-containing protein [Flavobacteriaceae bacterium]